MKAGQKPIFQKSKNLVIAQNLGKKDFNYLYGFEDSAANEKKWKMKFQNLIYPKISLKLVPTSLKIWGILTGKFSTMFLTKIRNYVLVSCPSHL